MESEETMLKTEGGGEAEAGQQSSLFAVDGVEERRRKRRSRPSAVTWCCGAEIVNEEEGNEIFQLQKEAKVWPMVRLRGGEGRAGGRSSCILSSLCIPYYIQYCTHSLL